jgi:glycopeptide antibiotics resistance protein
MPFTKIFSFCSLILLSIIFIYLSWIPQSSMVSSNILPHWFAAWLDQDSMMNLRTGIPMIFLGIFSCVSLSYNHNRFTTLLLSFVFACLLLLIAELGQYFIPGRHTDLADLGWGVIGNIVGMVIWFFVYEFFNYFFS